MPCDFCQRDSREDARRPQRGSGSTGSTSWPATGQLDEKTNIFRFQDRAKNPVQVSSTRSEKDQGRGTQWSRRKRSCRREKMRREAGRSARMGDLIRSEARPGETRRDEDQPRRRRRALNSPIRQFSFFAAS